MTEISELKTRIPTYVATIGQTLIQHGYEAYLVGGCVRDILSNRTPKDYDIATNAVPEQISALFDKAILVGARFGTVAVLVEDSVGETHQVEVTTYRSEADYIEGRWPSKVEYAKNIEEDLLRRDFTINAMAINLANSDEPLLDLHGGIADLNSRIIRAVGNPIERLSEDGLRSFRACRFASTLEFEIEENTFKAISETLNVAKMVSVERIQSEFIRMLLESPKPSVGIELMRISGLIQLFLPELLEGYGIDQNEYHVHDVYGHLLACVDKAHDDVKLAALLHDIAKPRTKVGGTFYGHDLKGAEMVKVIMKRLRFSNEETESVANLVRWHMFYYPLTEAKTDAQQHAVRREMMQKGWSDQAVRRFIRNVGGQDQIDLLFKLRIADATCNAKSSWDPTEIEALQGRISKVLEEDVVLKVTDLDIKGQDIIDLGIKPGPRIKDILNYLLEKVEENPNRNDREQLIELAKEKIND